MRNCNGNRISTVLIAGIATSAVAVIACLVMIFVNNSHLNSKEVANGLSATFDACESVANIAEIMGDMLSDDGEEALEIAEINAIDFRAETAAE